MSIQDPPERAVYTRKEFCEVYGISLSLFQHLMSIGKGPTVMWLGARSIRISKVAAAAWEREREADRATEADRLEQARKVDQTRAAARLAVQSPKHPHPKGSGKKKAKSLRM